MLTILFETYSGQFLKKTKLSHYNIHEIVHLTKPHKSRNKPRILENIFQRLNIQHLNLTM